MFKDRLKKLRKLHELTQEEVAKRLSISRPSYSRYETGEREPDFEMVKQIADFFETSADYLLGLADDPTMPSKILNIPDELEGVLFAFHRGEFEDLTQDEVDALAVIAKTLKAQRKDGTKDAKT